MLLDAGLGKQYWDEAVMTAAYVQNRLPSHAVDKTPFEKWFGRPPKMDYLRVFGCPAYVHVKRTKFDSKSRKLIFVGYCEDRKAFRFLDPENNGITISRDARFIEEMNIPHMAKPEAQTPEEIETELEWPEAVASQEENGARGEQCVQEEQLVPGKADHDSDEEFHDCEEQDHGDDRAAGQAGDVAEEQSSGKRSTRDMPPTRLRDYVVDVALVVEDDPVSYEEAVQGPEQDLWQAAMKEEYDNLMQNETWTSVELPAGRKPIASKWVFKKKEDSAENVTRYKARLVA